MSVPNQKTITIHASEEVPFLKIGKSEWQEAIKQLRYVNDNTILSEPKQEPKSSSIALYLYLACNADGYHLELSQKAFEEATGFSKSSYHRAIHELTLLHYIYKGADGSLNFATSPHEDIFQNWEKEDSNQKQVSLKSDYKESQIGDKVYSDLDREINNIDTINKNKEINNANKSIPSISTEHCTVDDFFNNKEEAEAFKKWVNSDEQQRIFRERKYRQKECARIKRDNEFGFEDY